MKKIAVALLAVMMAMVALFATGCGGGGLTDYFGLEKKNIQSITYKLYGKSPRTITEDKYTEFMKVFDVDYAGCSQGDIERGVTQYCITFTRDGQTFQIFLYVHTDGKIGASMYDNVGYTSYYITTSAVEIPISLKPSM